MNDILVQPSELRQDAGQLQTRAKKINAELLAIDNVLLSLKGDKFLGYRAERVQTHYASKREALLRAKDIIVHFAGDLQTAADTFEKADKPQWANKTTIDGFEKIKPYDGNVILFPGFYGRIRENFLDPSDYIIDANKIRTWVHEAAEYNDVPPELLAVILQQENAPDAPEWRRPLQYLERQLQMGAAVLNQVPLVGELIPDQIANGSMGIGNMTKKTLDGAVEYIENTYHHPVMPPDVLDTAIPGVSRDTRISGLDMQADIYYVSAHLRQLIDSEIGGGQPYQGALTREDIAKIAAAYNGSGDDAQKYGQDTVRRLEKANKGEEPLYFY